VNFVELMITIVILAFGVLGVAATAESAERAMMRARLQTEAAMRAGGTVDSLRGEACRVAGSARGSSGGESWTVAASGPVRYIVDSVRVNHRRFTVEGAVPCP
jgi:Tfp pilus assembly protein PilV